jgi:hypothetical protein
MSANGTPPAFQFDTFPTALQNAIGQGAKSDVRLAKRFVREKLSKKVQFLQPNNDDMMKKVYTDMPVDIPSSTSGVEATTIVPIKGSMPLLQLRHSTTSLCWRACSTITDRQ